MINYEKLYQVYQNYNIHNLPYEQLQKEYEEAVLKAYKEQFKKSVKSFRKAVDRMGEEGTWKIKKFFSDILQEKRKKREAIRDKMLNLLQEYAKNYSILPKNEMFLLKISDSGDYHTQGLGCNKYAESKLKIDMLFLKILGFESNVIMGAIYLTDRWGIGYRKYELWGNLTPLDFWVVKNKYDISLLDWAVLCWRYGTNPRVYFSFLDDVTYNKSLDLWNNNSYNITIKERKI